jgi:hypothetical protein
VIIYYPIYSQVTHVAIGPEKGTKLERVEFAEMMDTLLETSLKSGGHPSGIY